MPNFAIIVAGGSGSRMNAAVPKQFLLLAGKPILMHSIEAFYRFDAQIQIVLALPADQIEYWEKLCKDYQFEIQHKIVVGGVTRFYSVKNALDEVGYGGLVAIHDGVRPLVSNDTIERCFIAATLHGNAIPVIDMIDSVRMVDSGFSKPIDRSKLKLIQTPQVFNSNLIKEAYRQECMPEFTDDAGVAEKMGVQIHLVEGNRENIKITAPLDLRIGEALFTMRQ
jgi:2-C-methyl-D-erythritol 4-phosphate cytidylyltransferase